MRTRQSLIDDNASLLEQGIQLLENLDDELYSKSEATVASSGIGSHFRHLIDYYERFFAGVGPTGDGHLDYDQRQRDPDVEQRTATAQERLRGIAKRLAELTQRQLPELLTVKMDSAEEDANAPRSQSSVERELQFLMSHTVHHFALIAVILRLNGSEVAPEFGVAPSTLRHWRETRACAP